MSEAKEKPEVAFFVFFASIFHLGPWINSARLWAERGYNVTIFQLADPSHRKFDPLQEEGIRVRQIRGYYAARFLRLALGVPFRVFRLLGLERLAVLGEEIAYLVSSAAFYLAALRVVDRSRRYILIGGDPPGLAVAHRLAAKEGNILLYWSLELWIEADMKGRFVQRFWKGIEKRASREALLTIDFGRQRCELLARENGLEAARMISIPNAPLGAPAAERNTYFHEKFGLSADRRIVLYAGGLGGDFYGIEEMLEHVDSWPPEVDLVLHNRYESWIVERRVSRWISRRKRKVLLDMEPVEYDRLPLLYSSCDIGLQVWKPVGTNHRNPGLSAGKIFHYLQAGVPVVARRLEGYDEFIEGNGIGICVDEMSEVGGAIEKILRTPERFRENCLRAYRHYAFRPAHDEIVARVEKALGKG